MEARFEWRQALGKGGFGVVYEAYDRERHARVALKLLKQPDPANLYRLKHEFRTLADLSHPNLVALYELVADAEPSFIAMELVDGMDFVTYVSTPRPEDFGLTEREGYAAPDAETGLVDPPSQPIPRPPIQEWTCNIGRLLASLSQVTDALLYLHGAGRLHRDIKPSNVLVRTDGLVKVLDFGLATEFSAEAPAESHAVAGTPAYMSPEQVMSRPLTAASDWYSVGVMLFKSLTGHLPFAGTYLEMKRAKQLRDGPAPSKLVPTIPAGLDALCRDLLKIEPDDRPTGIDVRARLDRLMERETVQRPVDAPPPGGVFVGRQEQLHALADAVESTKGGHAAIVYVHGSSGMGKTSLVRRFLQNLRIVDANAVILAGRCYERESVAYKALDGIVDELTQHLRRLSRQDVETLLPRDVSALARLFPAFRRLEAVTHGQYRDAEIRDSQELRRRGFAAFRDLLARLADRQITVLFIDDLQWGDADSTALLIDLLRAPDPPPLLLVAAYRSEEVQTNAVLRLLPGHETPAAAGCGLWELDVSELTEPQARELASALMATHALPARAEAIVRESGCSPFFIDELVRFAAAGGATGEVETGRELTLESVIRSRADRLAPSARRLLEVLAVSGQPLKSRLASRAADLGAFEIEAMTTLRGAHLTRARVTEAGEAVEVYHDRIRQTIVSHLTPDQLRTWHARLASAFEGEPGIDPETLVIHYQGAGEPRRAAGYAVAAADRARDALAFDRAARLYRVALELGALDTSTRQQISVRLGDALANAGRGRDASLAYLMAADTATAASALELRRRAAEQLLRSGHIQEGYKVVRVVLDAMRMRLAESPQRALLSLLFRRTQLWFRGLRFTPRDESQIPAETLVRVDACWSLASALGVVDTIRGADFQCRHLLLALATGDRYRIARAIAIESAYVATSGENARPRQERLSVMAAELAEQVGHPHALALVVLARGISALLQGRWATSRADLEQAERMLSERCTGVAWELDAGRLYHLITLFNLGDLPELSRRLPKLLAEARERDDIMAVTSLRTRIGYLPHLFADDPASAREEVRQGMAQWAGEGFHAQHSWELFARGEIDLYAGRGRDAWTYVDRQWPALRRSLLLRIQGTRIELVYLRARAAVAAAAESDNAITPADRAARWRDAAKDAKRLAKESAPWASATAAIVRAGIAATKREGDRGRADLIKAEAAFRAAEMPLHAAVASRCRGLLDGAAGIRLVVDADGWMQARSIRSPAGMTAMLAPGTFSS